MKSRIVLAVLALITVSGSVPASTVCPSESDFYDEAYEWAQWVCEELPDGETCFEAQQRLDRAQGAFWRCLHQLDQNGGL